MQECSTPRFRCGGRLIIRVLEGLVGPADVTVLADDFPINACTDSCDKVLAQHYGHVSEKQGTTGWGLNQTAAAAGIASHTLCRITHTQCDLSIGDWKDSSFYELVTYRGDI